jgi:hypothetical protein
MGFDVRRAFTSKGVCVKHIRTIQFMLFHVPVAQLDRVSASEAEGRRFESCRARHFILSFSFTRRF